MKLYGFKQSYTEADIVAKLMEMYQKLTTAPTFIPDEKTKQKCKRRKKT
jgi:hypothetical protein